MPPTPTTSSCVCREFRLPAMHNETRCRKLVSADDNFQQPWRLPTQSEAAFVLPTFGSILGNTLKVKKSGHVLSRGFRVGFNHAICAATQTLYRRRAIRI